jgi:hypothetical protein
MFEYLVGTDSYDSGWDEYNDYEEAKEAALSMAQDEKGEVVIYKRFAEVKPDYKVVPVEGI